MSDYVEAIFKNRPNRFIAEVLINGELVKAHVPNTGRCKELLIEGVKVYLLPSDNSKRKTKYSLHFVENKGVLVSLYSQQANEIVFNGIKESKIKELLDYDLVGREKTIGNSRIDIYLAKVDKCSDEKAIYLANVDKVSDDEDLSLANGEYFILTEEAYLEVKGVTLIKDGLAQFPDAPTERGKKHLEELIAIKKRGIRAIVFFLIQHPLGNKFRPNWENDPEFAQTLVKAYDEGVEILVYKANNTLDGIEIVGDSLEFVLEK